MFQSELMEPRWKDGQVHLLNELFIEDSAFDLLNWALEIFSPSLYFECRFNLEDLVILDLFKKIGEFPIIFYIDSGKLPESTLALIKQYQKLGYQFQVYRPKAELLASQLDGRLSCDRDIKSQQKCSYLRLAEPRGRALLQAEGWLSAKRHEMDGIPQMVTIDHEQRGILKVNPLSHWSDSEIWEYVKSNKLLYNPLHEKGVRSITCPSCSQFTLCES